MSKKDEEQNRETENEKTDQIESNEEEEFDPAAYFESLTSGEPDEEEEPDPEPEPEKDEESDEGEGDEEENPPVEDEGPSEADKEKERQAVEAIGNKNYIDHELINSIEDKELRQKVWNLANTTQSHYNRLYQREQELGRMRGEMDRLKKEAEDARKPRTDAEKEKQDKEYSAKIDRLKSDYPDLADNIDALARSTFDEKSQQLRELIDQEYGQMRQQYQEDSRQRETQRLEEATNDLFDTARTGVSYRDVVASPDFAAWLETQPASVQRTARESDSAEELIPVFKTFDYDYSREYRKQFGKDWREDVVANRNQAEETQPSANSQATPVTSDGSDGPNEADEIAAKRDKKKRTSVTGVSPSRSAARSDVSLDDPEALFDHYVKQSARTRKR